MTPSETHLEDRLYSLLPVARFPTVIAKRIAPDGVTFDHEDVLYSTIEEESFPKWGQILQEFERQSRDHFASSILPFVGTCAGSRNTESFADLPLQEVRQSQSVAAKHAVVFKFTSYDDIHGLLFFVGEFGKPTYDDILHADYVAREIFDLSVRIRYCDSALSTIASRIELKALRHLMEEPQFDAVAHRLGISVLTLNRILGAGLTRNGTNSLAFWIARCVRSGRLS